MPGFTPIRISHYTFLVPCRFASGEPLDELTAQALNGHLSDNIRENVRSIVRKAEDHFSDGWINAKNYEAIQKKILNYYNKYQFSPGRTDQFNLFDKGLALANCPPGNLPTIEQVAQALAFAKSETELSRQALGNLLDD